MLCQKEDGSCDEQVIKSKREIESETMIAGLLDGSNDEPISAATNSILKRKLLNFRLQEAVRSHQEPQLTAGSGQRRTPAKTSGRQQAGPGNEPGSQAQPTQSPQPGPSGAQ